ncbi:hypothetical protein LSTR_LSTR013079 [Laodelphax striatellus]|uniref:AB hydrolase-1 domain-containing protein n=1 Tax=Laodelphax striatellus TaxID=195883 RepID=A0A482XME9_LAOST|nr:hypothetical protein LSTR_LSTR013079 [Laodelphax striatellus]
MSIFRSISLAVPRLSASRQTYQPVLIQHLLVSMGQRRYSQHPISKGIDLFSGRDQVRLRTGRAAPLLVSDQPRPLAVVLAWMMAQPRNLAKYTDIYLRRGYDVVTVNCTPWQLLWPVKGSQVIAEDLINFLDENKSCQPIVLHGFSVGGYVWGEVMVRLKEDLARYQSLIDRIVGQTWDSAADFTEFQVGLPLAVFPDNPLLRGLLERYVSYHLKTFHDVATIHYLRSSQLFHTTLVKAPALLLVSETDPIGSAASNRRLRETWDSMGIKTHWKCWEDSKHVCHLMKHRQEYTDILESFLDSIEQGEEANRIEQKMQAKL